MDQQILIKIISVGDTQVGKSCLIKRYCEGRFINKYVTTIGVDYGVKKMTVNNKKIAVLYSTIQINFFDLSGDDDYKEIRNAFFADAQGVLLVFDVADKASFQSLPKWEKLMVENGLDLSRAVVFLVANKADVKTKEVDANEMQAYARKKNYECFVCSASTGDNVNEIFEKLFSKVLDNMEFQRSKLLK